jgi:hypothetical protein
MAFRQCNKQGSEMHDAKADVNPGSADVAPAHTLDDLRVVQHDYAASGGLSAKGRRWALFAVIVIAVGAGIAWKLRSDAVKAGTTVGAANAAAGPILSSSLPATASRSMADEAAGTAPLIPLDAVASAARSQRVAHRRLAQTSPDKTLRNERVAGAAQIENLAPPMPASAFGVTAFTRPVGLPAPVVAPLVVASSVALPAVAALAAATAEPPSQ